MTVEKLSNLRGIMFEERLREGVKGTGEENHFMHEKGVREKERESSCSSGTGLWSWLV